MAQEGGLLLSDDLLFASRVTATARAKGLDVRLARSPEALLVLARERPPRCVLIDLQHPGLDLPALAARLAESCPAPPRLVGYGSHVEAQALHAAREAGCDPAWPRSKFAEELETALPAWLAAP
jgi:CheY-like chemotaxis protein